MTAAAIVGPGQVWSAWASEPLAAVGLVLLAFGYLRGVERLWRQAGRGRVVGRWQVGGFGAAWVALLAALASPIDGLAGTLLSVHMVQHLLLALLAAPLLVVSGPLLPLIRALPDGLARRVHGWRPPSRWRRRGHSFAATAAAAGAYVAVLWLWHAPPLYEAALRSGVLHALEHVTMLGAAMALWTTVLQRGGPRRRSSPTAALAMFATATLTVGLGALLTFSPGPWYAHYAPGAAAWGLTALQDQQRAGAIMWSIGGLLTTAIGAVSFWAWLAAAHQGTGHVTSSPSPGRPADEETRDRRSPPCPRPEHHGS
jgi:putative membrane protein